MFYFGTRIRHERDLRNPLNGIKKETFFPLFVFGLFFVFFFKFCLYFSTEINLKQKKCVFVYTFKIFWIGFFAVVTVAHDGIETEITERPK